MGEVGERHWVGEPRMLGRGTHAIRLVDDDVGQLADLCRTKCGVLVMMGFSMTGSVVLVAFVSSP